MKSVTIPASVTYMDYYVFQSCSRLTDIYYAKGELAWMSLAGSKIPDSIKVHYNSTAPVQQYTVFLDTTGGTMTGSDTKTVTNGKTYGTLPTPTRDGYTFSGWYTQETGGTKITSSTTVRLTDDQMLFAHWTPKAVKTYTITFNANGGSVSPTTKKVAENTSYGELPVPSRDDYIFDGWYTSRTGGTKVTEDTVATANRTVYAHWIEEPDDPDDPDDSDAVAMYTLTFNPNGGRVHQRAKLVVSGGTYQALPTPYRDDYHFEGWYTARTGGRKITEKTDVTLTGNQTLYAHWTKSPVFVESRESGSWRIRFPSNFHFPVYNSETTADMHADVGY